MSSIWTGRRGVGAQLQFIRLKSRCPSERAVAFFLAFDVSSADLAAAWPLSVAGVWRIEASGGLLLASMYGSESTLRREPTSIWRFVMASRLISCCCWFLSFALSAFFFSFFSASASFLTQAFVSTLAFSRCISHWSLKAVILAFLAATGSSMYLTFLEARAAFKAAFCSILDVALSLLGIVLCKQAKIAGWCFVIPYQGARNWMRDFLFITESALFARAIKQPSDMIRLWGIGFLTLSSFHKCLMVSFLYVLKAAVR